MMEVCVLGVICGGIWVWSFYVFNGCVLDDLYYIYKLDWFVVLCDMVEGWLCDDFVVLIVLMGDWNIVLIDDDVWSIEFFVGCMYVFEFECKVFNVIVDV